MVTNEGCSGLTSVPPHAFKNVNMRNTRQNLKLSRDTCIFPGLLPVVRTFDANTYFSKLQITIKKPSESIDRLLNIVACNTASWHRKTQPTDKANALLIYPATSFTCSDDGTRSERSVAN